MHSVCQLLRRRSRLRRRKRRPILPRSTHQSIITSAITPRSIRANTSTRRTSLPRKRAQSILFQGLEQKARAMPERPARQNCETKKRRGPSTRALFFLLLRRLASGIGFNRFDRDSHRKSGVLSFLALLSPVDSCNPPELEELTNCLYARAMRGASKKKKKEDRTVSRAFSADCLVDFSEDPKHRRLVSILSTRRADLPLLTGTKKRPPIVIGGL